MNRKILFLMFILILFSARFAFSAVGWVGNLYPASGSTSYITGGESITIYVQVYKAGVTDQAGQGSGIACELYWGRVTNFGESWLATYEDAMTYNTDIGNNDEYMITITPPAGKYEFTARASDDGGATWIWSDLPSGSGKIDVSTISPDDISWNELGHNSFETVYRNPFGAVKTNQGNVTIRFRTKEHDVSGVRIRVYDDYLDSETFYTMLPDYSEYDSYFGVNVQYWVYSLPIPTDPTILYYFFEVTDGSDTDYYIDDDVKFRGGGWGTVSDAWNDSQSYQLTVYDEAFTVPEWLQGAVIYQIFPDRFRNGDPTNDPDPTDDVYGQTVRLPAWNDDLCDPRALKSPTCDGEWANVFYGGDLQGVLDKLDYLQNLGVTSIYFNPIFKAASNHLYDTQNYMAIDPYLGDLGTFQTLAAETESRGMELILDGVFNHTSSDSRYFDYSGRWPDELGACESTSSPYRDWYYFVSESSGYSDKTECGHCATDGDPVCYRAWWGYGSIPKLNTGLQDVRDLFYAQGTSSVGPYWLSEGADGWRFDVGDDIDPGLTHDPGNDFWEGFHAASEAENSDMIMLGEVWGDVSPFLLGNEWHSVMNYRFRSAVLCWMFDGCDGNGCGETYFEDNDNNSGSAGGAIYSINESEFDTRLKSIQEDYPPECWKAMMNLMGSHDTNRVHFLLRKISSWDLTLAEDKLKFLSIFQYTYPGAPTVYYGDEAGIAADGVYDSRAEGSQKWEDDPYNRAAYPWSDEGLTPDQDLIDHYSQLGSIHNTYSVFQTGDYETLLTDDTNRIFAFRRYIESGRSTDNAVVIMNRDQNSHNVTLDVSGFLTDGTQLTDVLNGGSYTVSGGNITVSSLGGLWAAILVGSSAVVEQNIVVEPASWDFGTVETGSSVTKSIKITNDGGATLSISSQSISGTGFSISDGGGSVTLNPGQFHYTKVQFAPSTDGSKSGTLTINSDDPETPSYDVSLQGVAQTEQIATKSLPYCEDFESDNGGYFAAGTNNQWEYGTPSFDETNNCWGTDLDANYVASSVENLDTPNIDLTGISDAVLTFWHIAETESNGDKCYIDIYSDGSWQPISVGYYKGNATNYSTDGYFHEGSYTDWNSSDAPQASWWKMETFSLKNYAGKVIRIRFRFESNSTTQKSGWYVDEICVDGGAEAGGDFTEDASTNPTLQVKNGSGSSIGDFAISSGTGAASFIAIVNDGQYSGMTNTSNFWWDLTTEGDNNWCGNLTLYYDDSNLGAIGDESLITIYHWNGSAWESVETDMGKTVNLDTANNTITIQNICRDEFSPFTLTGGETPLPVELADFHAESQQNGILIYWETESEINNEGFYVYRSLDNKTYSKISPLIEGHGTTNQLHSYSFMDKNVTRGKLYYYKISDVESKSEKETFHGPLAVIFGQGEIDPHSPPIPDIFRLHQNIPNPFNPETTIYFDLPKSTHLELKIYDTHGKLVRTLEDSQKDAGYHSVIWDGNDDTGQSVSSGVYIYRIKTAYETDTKRMILVK